MGTLAIDIETASPDKEPSKQEHFRDTSYFELVAIAVGYRDGSRTESDVLFRKGGWEQEHTADLLERLFTWCDGRGIETVLTYNGNGFDRIHLENWSRSLDENGVTTDMTPRIESLFAGHRDLAEPSFDKYRSRISGGGTSFERICEWEDIDIVETRYADYDLHESVYKEYGSHVKGQHIGESLGEMYVDLHVSGATDTTTYRQLKRMLTDYAAGDVIPLFELNAHLS
ncbi:hypothetical protein [Halopenitus persicus]|uniref:hypothetical protein n=1 Tax=Halopenitus persicus TaxID=1048396 RepID=UPI000BBB0A26|nr:hypothetical protein [Halopenitus persicus]